MADACPIKKAKFNFEHSGEFDEDDEVTFTFPKENNKQLFFSKLILTRSSSAFEAMFKHDFKERKDKNVIIEDIKMEVFNTFFRWCDPKLSEPITAENVFQMVEFADKYQIESMIQHYRRVMLDIVNKAFEQAKMHFHRSSSDVEQIVMVLLVATKYNYKELLDRAEDYLVCYEVKELLSKDPFEKLPLELKYRILSRRISKVYQEVGFAHAVN
ncbi:hypothetical protein MAR_011423 [Mya arenaria]|uniref:BTB domain-containing protein n=1 Tax=Mya arenaria TaxID=6604 RepID=A0ABY7FX57_MYAAR|nr:uncharacterized protein LOC128218589 [Mya arenaria]WAR25719.1 hypothetical protein MAR_011423 [Mya arenaria]